MKEADAPSITQYAIKTTSVSVCSAASMAIGNINAAAALLVTTLLIKKVARYTAANNPAATAIKTHESESRKIGKITKVCVSYFQNLLTAFTD